MSPHRLIYLFFLLLQTVMYGAGGRVGFFQGDIRLLPDDMKTLQPTIFPVVPRLLNRVYDKVSTPKESHPQVEVSCLLLRSFLFPTTPAGPERCIVCFQEMAPELCRREEIRRGQRRHHQEEQPVGQTHLPQSPGTEFVF